MTRPPERPVANAPVGPPVWSWAKEYADALRYISSPTMGLPGGRDALDFVDEASEAMVRLTLKACIRTARQALQNDQPASSPAAPTAPSDVQP